MNKQYIELFKKQLDSNQSNSMMTSNHLVYNQLVNQQHIHQQPLHLQIVKELTHQNTILNQQLQEYKTLVLNLQAKIQSLTSLHQQNIYHHNNNVQHQSIYQQYQTNQQQRDKLQTIEEEMNSYSEIATNSRRRMSCEDGQGGFVGDCWRLLMEDDSRLQETIEVSEMRQVLYEEIQRMKFENRQLKQLAENIWLMRDKIQPCKQNTIIQLWNWLKLLGSNYKTILSYHKQSSSNHPHKAYKPFNKNSH